MPKGTGDILGPLPLTADPEFSTVCWQLTSEEKSFLIESIKKNGCRDPILYWECDGKNLIVDGHTRHEICFALGLPYPAAPMQFADRQAVIEWIIGNQLGKRNATEVQKSHLRGRLYIERKQVIDESLLSENRTVDESVKVRHHRGLAKQVAQETGIKHKRVYADAIFTQAMDRLAQKSPPLRDAALAGHIGKEDAQILADASLEVVRGVEASPESDWKACASAAANSIKDQKPKSGRPIVYIRALADLEKAGGVLVRAKTTALEACGGEKCVWAFEHAEALRHLCNQMFDEILGWARDAETKREVV